jgi:dTDP-glucose pyrophosphorylase
MGFTAIIPAAGKGTRMGSPVDGKEMMLDLVTGRPLIDFAIMAAEDAGCDKIVVAIEQDTKPVLISHIQQTFPQVYIQLTKPEGEWPSTVLQTEPQWDPHHNVLILPDTRYNSQELKHLVMRHTDSQANL